MADYNNPNDDWEDITHEVDDWEDLAPKAIPQPIQQVQSQQVEPESISKTTSFIKGAEQGGTFGFADELGAAEQSILDKLMSNSVTDVDAELARKGFTGDLTPSTSDLYRKAQKDNEAEYQAAQEANPLTYLGGNLAGAIATGGAAQKLISKGLVGATGMVAPKLAPAVASAINPTEKLADIYKNRGAIQSGIELLKRGGADVVASMPIGAAMGFGGSSGDLSSEESSQKLKEDVLNDVMYGSLFTGGAKLASEVALPVAGLAKDKLGEFLMSSPRAREIVAGFKTGKMKLNPMDEQMAGIRLGDKSPNLPPGVPPLKKKNVLDPTNVAAADFDKQEADALQQMLQDMRKSVGAVKKEAEDKLAQNPKGIQFTPGSKKKDLDTAIDTQYLQADDSVKKLLEDMYQPQSYEAFQNNLGRMDDIINSLTRSTDVTSDTLKRQLLDVKDEIVQQFRTQHPELAEANKRYAKFMEVYDALAGDAAGSNMYNRVANKDDVVNRSLQKLLQAETNTSNASKIPRSMKKSLMEKLDEAVEHEATFGADARLQKDQTDALIKRLQESGDYSGMQQAMRSKRKLEDPDAGGLIKSTISGLGGYSVAGSRLGGRTSRAIKDVSKSIQNGIYKMNDQSVKDFARYLDAKGMKKEAQLLSKAILPDGTLDNKLKNAALFSILQRTGGGTNLGDDITGKFFGGEQTTEEPTE